MDSDKRTQKQISERHKGNPDYFRHPSIIRRSRGWLYVFAIGLSLTLLGAVLYRPRLPGRGQSIFNPGPISRAHAFIANDCARCHPQIPQIEGDKRQVRQILGENYWDRLDAACQTCHKGYFYHQANQINQAPPRGADETVSCSACHREHITAGRMASPDEARCDACHNRSDLMVASAQFATTNRDLGFFDWRSKKDGYYYYPKPRPANGFPQAFRTFGVDPETLKPVARTPEIHIPFAWDYKKNPGDPRLQLPPAWKDRIEKEFRREFNQENITRTQGGRPELQVRHLPMQYGAADAGHPELVDDAQVMLRYPKSLLHYNHAIHMQDNVKPTPTTKVNISTECAYCHLPDGRGNFLKITYERSCKECHAMAIDPSALDIEVPHGRPEQVRQWIQSIGSAYMAYYAKQSPNNPQAAGADASAATQRIIQRFGGGTDSAAAVRNLEAQIFLSGGRRQGDPRGADPLGKDLSVDNRVRLISCAYCHAMEREGEPYSYAVLPQVRNIKRSFTGPNGKEEIRQLPDRWFSGGGFNHAKHERMNGVPSLFTCVACHTSIPQSAKSEDVNLPSQFSCTACHHNGPEGVKNDCNSCHTYHLDPRRSTDPNAPALSVKADIPPRPTLRDLMLGKQ